MGTPKRDRQKAARQARLDQARAEEARRKRNRTVRNAVLFVALVVVIALVVARPWQSDPDDDEVATDGTTSTTASVADGEFAYGSGECPAEDGSSPPQVTFDAAPQLCIDPEADYTATFETTLGDVEFALDTAATPGTVNNFVTLARYHYYDGTTLFRTNTSIGIIQGGSPTTNDGSDPGPGYELLDEGFVFETLPGGDVGQPTGGPYAYAAGELVMARSAQPNGASAQFFFCATDACSGLDGQGVYVTFGEVVSGQDVLDEIIALHEDGENPGEGAPSEPVTVEAVTITETAAETDADADGPTTTAGGDDTTTTTGSDEPSPGETDGTTTTTTAPEESTTTTGSR